MDAIKYIIILIFSIAVLSAEIIYESGSLMEFVGGSSSTTEYDNYVSHITEGIASPGYNDYGPDWLDVQSNGFGNYTVIPNNSSTLSYWRSILNHFLSGDYEAVDMMLQDSVDVYHYQIVNFIDTTYNQEYYMLRENLNMNYIDYNILGNSEDDVIGSFENGWGLYIINTQPENQSVIIEAPHPNDDFISPYIGTILFQEIGAIAMLISGVGREVLWNEEGNYNNNKSLCDPSRNSNTVFHQFHEVLSDSIMLQGPQSPVVLQMHSFDDNESHLGYKSIIMSGGWDAPNAGKPIRDITNDHLDFINFTEEIVHEANIFGSHDYERINDYYAVHYTGEFSYYGGHDTISIPHTNNLVGPNSNKQLTHLHSFFPDDYVYEPWVQVEMHERPVLFDDIGMEVDELYQGTYPTSYNNFLILIQYYTPFIEAVKDYFYNWNNVPDITAPDVVTNFNSTYDGYYYVEFKWDPVDDTNFKTYDIFFNSGDVTEQSPSWNMFNDYHLAGMRTDTTAVFNLPPNHPFNFAIRAIDYFGNASVLSEMTTDSVPGHPSHEIIENFNDGNVILESYEDEDIEPNNWTLSTDKTFMNSSYSLQLHGNTWKTQEISPHQVENNDMWQIAMFTQQVGEIHGFGVQDSLNTMFYSFSGSEMLDIEEWITVYQGEFPNNRWIPIRMPIADDWYARYDYYPLIEKLIYVNDSDEDETSSFYFDEIFDITNVVDNLPEVQIEYEIGEILLNRSGERSVDIQFYSLVEDDDSDSHNYYWSFGDDSTSNGVNPLHTFLVEDDHPYTVLLQVSDETNNWGYATVQIAIDAGETSFPISMNFVGDIMVGRNYEGEGGIIEAHGIEYIFEPTLHLLGENADITVANLECPLTNHTIHHPTKPIYFKGSPESVAGLTYAGIDVVSLANNHCMDYNYEGIAETQEILSENGISHSGVGINAYEAYLPLFIQRNGLNIALLANSDRTGQYNNYQPYLNAGVDKPGFAYLTPYYINQQIEAVEDIADLIIVEMHAGSEYSTQPSSDYDKFEFSYIDVNDNSINPMNQYDYMDVMEDEDYFPDSDVPHVWDRELRHHTIDSGADLVVIHHPHIIQGLELYNGKLIAHSLGNFIFDLSYPETFPSIILNSLIDETGFYAHSISPVIIDDYIPLPAIGNLGVHILRYIANKSREMDTYLHVDKQNLTATVIMDTLSIPLSNIYCSKTIGLDENSESEVEIFPNHGNISLFQSPELWDEQEFRVGRELVWMGNFEDEGSSLWNVNSNYEWLDEEVSYEGEQSLKHERTPSSPDNIITNLEKRLKIKSNKAHSIHGYLKTENGADVTIEIRFYTSRSGSQYLSTEDIGVHLSGNNDWEYFSNKVEVPEEAKYFDIRLNSNIPNTGTAHSWFDNVGVVEWESWVQNENQFGISLAYPNDYNYYQVKKSIPDEDTEIDIQFVESVLDILPQQVIEFSASNIVGTMPFAVNFMNETSGITESWLWTMDSSNYQDENPSHIFTEPGFYDISLQIMDYNGNPTNLLKHNYIAVFEGVPNPYGDINQDHQVNVLDVIAAINLLLNEQSLTDYQLWSSDFNNNSIIDIFDIVEILSIYAE
jgi:poly-gamma-glutamate capsule biosynthesis protein CapA/YwtB (metallophosphatase superfamily)